MDLPDVIPLFPLPNVVHFPGVPLPLHVFEPRYRAMVRDALAGSRLIGMVLLRSGWEGDYHGAPAIFDVGTAGEIVRADPLEDGRWNVVLRGVREFEIVTEQPALPGYRTAQVVWRIPRPGAVSPEAAARVWEVVRRYLAAQGRQGLLPAGPEPGTDPALVVNFFAQQLDLAPIERQALLAEPDEAARAERLVTAIEFQVETLRRGGSGSGTLQ